MDEQILISRRVCVAGASGRVGSWLVMKLLERGHIVHATIRNLSDPVKTGLLKSLPGADSRLLLFEADLFHPHQFQQAIQGCDFVFLVAFPTLPFRNHRELPPFCLPTAEGGRWRSGTGHAAVHLEHLRDVRHREEAHLHRLRHHGFAVGRARSRLQGLHRRVLLDEFYTSIKTASEKQLMDYGSKLEGENSPLEVVALTCGVVGGEALVESLFGVGTVLSPLTGDTVGLGHFKFLQDLLCSVPLVHLDDVCEAHLFCMDVPLTGGRRFLCASDYPSMWDIITYHRLKHSDLLVAKEPEGRQIRITGGSTRLRDMGFEYKYTMEQILDDSVRFAKKLGVIKDT